MKILCLYANECALELFQWLKERGHEITLWTEKLDAEWCRKQGFDLAVSYTYPFIISRAVILALDNNVVNLHNSFLPFNRGSYPNVWSILENTPRGVTLHYINDELDKGDIIVQCIVPLERNATLKSSYEQLDLEAKRLFKDAFKYYTFWNSMRKGSSGKGTYHKDMDFIKLKRLFPAWEWNMPADEFLEKTKFYLMEVTDEK